MSARLEASGVTVRLGGRVAVSDITLALPAGAVVALVGPNGAGKTTLLRAVAGLVPTEGGIVIDDASLAAMPLRERARRIAYLPQGHQAHWPLAARDIVALGRAPHGAGDPSALNAANRAAVDDALSRTGALDLADRSILALSGGERARVMLARALATQAPILLADEPTAALDPRHQLLILQTLRAEAARGALVIAVTHDLALAARTADIVLVMNHGRLVAEGQPRRVLTPALLRDVYGVEALFGEPDGQALVLPWRLA